MFNSTRLNDEIKRRGFAKTELSKLIPASYPSLMRWTLGTAQPAPADVLRVLKALGYTDEEIRSQRLTDWYTVNGEA